MNNRIDVKDTKGKWLEAIVVAVNGNGTIRVHYKGFTSKWEEDLPIDSERIKQIGLKSDAQGSGRLLRPNYVADLATNEEEDSEEIQQQKKILMKNEEILREELDKIGLRIVAIGADGNCLFRAFSHQIYGEEDHFKFIRKKCMEYLDLERDYFSAFLPEKFPNMDLYIQAKIK